MAQPSTPDWDPEESTKPGLENPGVRQLLDPDPLVSLGKMARAIVDVDKKVSELAAMWKAERRTRARKRRREAVSLAAFIAAVQGVIVTLHQIGVLK